MRIRRKKWARPELELCKYHITNPKEYRGKWSNYFENDKPIHLELGCGRGTFVSKIAHENRNINYIGIDIKTDMLGYAKRNIDKEYGEEKPNNVCIFSYNIEQILDVFDKSDNIKRIYINFCNPWPRPKHKKRRLTHTRQLNKYKEIGNENLEIYFKTDDDNLFEESLKYFEEEGFEVKEKTYDLHKNDIIGGNIITEHEEMFTNQGIKIKALIATL